LWVLYVSTKDAQVIHALHIQKLAAFYYTYF